MSTIYLCIVIFLLCLAVFDLFVGVSNDAVNFLQSAIGAKVAKFRTVLIIASCGVVLGAIMSSGMMDIARHGIMSPDHFTFEEVMTLFLAVMVTDVIILDVFNTLGMPTSTTVSLVFELLGGAFILATLKMYGDDSLNYGVLLNSNKALEVIMGIFSSVIIAFVFGAFVMWLSRIVFTFNYRKHSRYSIAIFGGIAFTALSYFIFMKGLGKSPYLPAEWRNYIDQNLGLLLCITFVGSAIVMEFLHLCRINIFKFTVLMGTFALAMAFAGNDLVNFIGVPLAGLSSYQDYMANGNGATPDQFMMTSLMDSAKTTPVYLLAAGAVMIIAMATSKKAQNVIKTSVDLSRQDEGDEMFGSSSAARVIVRNCQATDSWLKQFLPKSLMNWINSRFDKNDVELEESAAFDVVRAAVNLVLASMLITIGTNLKLPLSTTYVTFMVAMGSSLADRAWSRESAVFRITGVLTVIGGWFITAGVAFSACFVVALLMNFGGVVAVVIIVAAGIYSIIHSQQRFARKQKEAQDGGDVLFQQILAEKDRKVVINMLTRHINMSVANMLRSYATALTSCTDGLLHEQLRPLRQSLRKLTDEKRELKSIRRRETICLRRVYPPLVGVRLSTSFHLIHNSLRQQLYGLIRIAEPAREHVDNHFSPIDGETAERFCRLRNAVTELMTQIADNMQHQRIHENDLLVERCGELEAKAVEFNEHVAVSIQGENSNLNSLTLMLHIGQEIQQITIELRELITTSKTYREQLPQE